MPEAPKFNSFEEIQEWLNSQSESDVESSEKPKESSTPKKKSSASSRSKKKTQKKPVKKDEALKFNEEKRPDIWSSVHFYTREGDSFTLTKKDAKEEAGYRNENVLVFYHDHIFGEACTKNCGGI